MSDIELNEISLVAKRATCLYSASAVQLAIDNIAAQITKEHSATNPILMCVMNGGLVLTAKLAERLRFPLSMDYVHATRYRGKTTAAELQWERAPSIDLSGRVVIIVDDILDEGITLKGVVEHCELLGADEVHTVVLVNKQHDRKVVDFSCDFVGLEIEDRYVYGSGMDYKGYFRNVPGIYAVNDLDE